MMNTMHRRSYIALFLLVALALCGCRRTLFPKQVQRTQFQAYNTMRYGPQITEQPDPFGVPEPALRERLSSKD